MEKEVKQNENNNDNYCHYIREDLVRKLILLQDDSLIRQNWYKWTKELNNNNNPNSNLTQLANKQFIQIIQLFHKFPIIIPQLLFLIMKERDYDQIFKEIMENHYEIKHKIIKEIMHNEIKHQSNNFIKYFIDEYYRSTYMNGLYICIFV